MSLLAHQLELLSPAKTAEIGREAILHGADAVYIGGPAFGARHNASNTIEEISSLVDFAHRYRSRSRQDVRAHRPCRGHPRGPCRPCPNPWRPG